MGKHCTKCHKYKLLEDFGLNSKMKDGRASECLTCRNKRETAVLTPATFRRWALRKRYGLTPEEYDELLGRQNRVCAICGNPEANRNMAVDHDHETGKVRGILCGPCNRKLGVLENEDFVSAAKLYLERNAQ